jgi:hypothetical protein
MLVMGGIIGSGIIYTYPQNSAIGLMILCAGVPIYFVWRQHRCGRDRTRCVKQQYHEGDLRLRFCRPPHRPIHPGFLGYPGIDRSAPAAVADALGALQGTIDSA